MITSSGSCLGELEEADIVVIDFNGNISEQGKKPSSESLMHLEIYKKRADIKAIIHAHPVKSTVFAVTGITLNRPILSEAIISLGTIALAEYATPSSKMLADNVASYFQEHDVVLMANHGVVVAGKTIKEAYLKLETLEAYAEISLWTAFIGKANELSEKNIKDLMNIRKKLNS